MTQRLLTITGVAGTASQTPVTGERGAIAAWLLHVPGLHAFWAHWSLTLVSLRDIEGVPAAVKLYPQAEYEVLVVALDPAVTPSAESTDAWKPLRPLNICEQFHGVSPGEAAAIVEELARDVAQGRLIPEPQGIQGAAEMWGAAIQRHKERAIQAANQRAIDRAVSEMKGEDQE